MKKARIIITLDCNRKCIGCVNTYTSTIQQAKYLTSLNQLPDKLEEIIITGGETMLRPIKTFRIVKELRNKYSLTKIYMYTAWFKPFIKASISSGIIMQKLFLSLSY